MPRHDRTDEAQSRALREFWDATVLGDVASPRELDPALAEAVRRMHAAASAPPAAPEFADRLWQQLMEHGAKTPDVRLGAHSPNGPAISRRDLDESRGATKPRHRPPRLLPWRSTLDMLATAALLLLVAGFAIVMTLRQAPEQRLYTGAPMARGGAARTGEQAGPGPVALPAARWTVTTGGRVAPSPSLVAGVVYFGGDDGVFLAIDAESGAERWRYQARGAIGAPPAVAAGVVCFGDQTGTLYALDAATGSERWRATAPAVGQEASLFASSPAVVDGMIFVISGIGAASPAVSDGVVYVAGDQMAVQVLRAFEATTWKLLWSYPPESGTSGLRSNGLVAIDAQRGAKLWDFPTDDYVQTTPAVSDGLVYFGSHDGVVYAVDAATGQERWRFDTGGAIYSSPAVVKGTVYVDGGDGNLYALDAATGAERWRSPVGTAHGSSPGVADGAVYIVSDGWLNAIDARTGAVRWRIDTGAGSDASAVVAGGSVFVGGLNGEGKAIVSAFG